MLRKRVVTVLVALLAGAFGSLALAAPAHANDHISALQSQATGFCLQPQGRSTDAGAAILQMPCDGTNFQSWFLKDLGDHVFFVRNVQTNMCLDAFGGAANGTGIVQWPCAGISNQHWRASRDLPGLAVLRSEVAGTSSHCLDVPGGQRLPGLQVQLWGCNGTAAQGWGIGISTPPVPF